MQKTLDAPSDKPSFGTQSDGLSNGALRFRTRLSVRACPPAPLAASDRVGPTWQFEQRPFPVKTARPRVALALSAPVSMGAWSETSVSAYNWFEGPQKSEKLFSICVGPPFHRSFWNASWIIPTYVEVRPLWPAFGFHSPPSTLSVELTTCPASGVRPISFCPSCGNERPLHDISVPLFGGPTAWEAALALRSRLFTGWGTPPTVRKITALAVSAPCGSTPLNSLRARPSQKLRKLNAALMFVGVLRPVTRRTLWPPTLKPLASIAVPSHTSDAGEPKPIWMKLRWKTPCDPLISSVSLTTAEALLFTSLSLWNGKSAATSVAFGPFVNRPFAPGFTLFVVRTSAPALKWQLAHACTPSPPVC